MQRLQFIVAAFVLTSIAIPAYAQMGRAFGAVNDSAGKPIKGAVVKATNKDAFRREITSTTDNKGRFGMIGLSSGTWTFTAEAPGYVPNGAVVPIRQGTPAPLRFVLERSPEPIPGALPKDIDRLLDSAQTLRREGRYDQALSAYQAIQSKNPKLTTLSLVIADLYREKAAHEQDATARRALYDRAIASYGDMLKTSADNDRARIELGLTQQAAGNVDAAARTFQDIIAAAPGSSAAAEAAAYLQAMKK
jgi:tetratricopeptide (TPR) repeat protein